MGRPAANADLNFDHPALRQALAVSKAAYGRTARARLATKREGMGRTGQESQSASPAPGCDERRNHYVVARVACVACSKDWPRGAWIDGVWAQGPRPPHSTPTPHPARPGRIGGHAVAGTLFVAGWLPRSLVVVSMTFVLRRLRLRLHWRGVRWGETGSEAVEGGRDSGGGWV